MITLGEPLTLSDANARLMHAAGIRVIETPLERIEIEGDRIARIVFADGAVHEFDAIYSALGIQPRADLAATLGVELLEDGRIVVDHHQRTSVEDCYAVGDIVTGLNQLGVAMAQGEIAAVDIHNRLREREGLKVQDSDSRVGQVPGTRRFRAVSWVATPILTAVSGETRYIWL